jgi:hypothetical protein
MSWLKFMSLLAKIAIINSVSATTINVSCLKIGSPQKYDGISISSGISNWFSNSKVGATCNVGETYTTGCNTTSIATTCELQGNYDVWDSQYMSCTAYGYLQTQARIACGTGGPGQGFADCSCAVYLTSSCGNCLVASWSYHAEGMLCSIA